MLDFIPITDLLVVRFGENLAANPTKVLLHFPRVFHFPAESGCHKSAIHKVDGGHAEQSQGEQDLDQEVSTTKGSRRSFLLGQGSVNWTIVILRVQELILNVLDDVTGKRIEGQYLLFVQKTDRGGKGRTDARMKRHSQELKMLVLKLRGSARFSR